MSRAIALPSIIDIVLSSIEHAHHDYKRWSDGLWLWNAPEYLTTTTIAQKLGSTKRCRIELEKDVRTLLNEAQISNCQGIRTGRFDIALYYMDNYPRGIIEVKNQIHTKRQCEADIERIAHSLMLDPDSSTLQFGIFTFYSSMNIATSECNSVYFKLEDIHDWLTNELPEILVHEWYEKVHTDNIEGDWSANCITIMRK